MPDTICRKRDGKDSGILVMLIQESHTENTNSLNISNIKVCLMNLHKKTGIWKIKAKNNFTFYPLHKSHLDGLTYFKQKDNSALRLLMLFSSIINGNTGKMSSRMFPGTFQNCSFHCREGNPEFFFFPPCLGNVGDKQLNKSQLVLDALGAHIHVVFPSWHESLGELMWCFCVFGHFGYIIYW